MVPHSLLPRLNDILRSIEIVQSATRGKSLEQFSADPILRLAVERAVEIVSEAARHIPESERTAFPEIPWRNITAIGNKLRHEYDRLDADIIWDVATNHLNAQKPVIEVIRARQKD